MFGVEKSFLEAEYQCHDGYKLTRKSKRKTLIKNKNLFCKNRRWLGPRPMCKEMKAKSIAQQCDGRESRQCEQLCIKRDNSTEVTCYCHKGFRLIGTRCFGKLKWKTNENSADELKTIKILLFLSPAHPRFRSDINECEEDHPVSAETESVSTRLLDHTNVCVRRASAGVAAMKNAWVSCFLFCLELLNCKSSLNFFEPQEVIRLIHLRTERVWERRSKARLKL